MSSIFSKLNVTDRAPRRRGWRCVRGWRILTVEILSAVEQGGMSLAAAYSVILIVIVLVAIGLTYFILGRTLGSSGQQVDLNL